MKNGELIKNVEGHLRAMSDKKKKRMSANLLRLCVQALKEKGGRV